jgi:ferredoxin-NADP reductase
MPLFTTEFRAAGELAEGTASFRFAKPEGFAFKAGQSLNLTLLDPPETDAKGATRTFSIASAPHEPWLEIATRLRDTAFKRVLRKLAPGTRVQVRGPGGRFVLGDEDRPAVFLAGGIGITPFMSMLRQAAHEGARRKLLLVYSNRRPEDAPYLSELESLRVHIPDFTLVGTMTDMGNSSRPWDGERALVDGDFVARHAGHFTDAIYFVAGPPGMVAALRQSLAAAGAKAGDIRSDEFFGY